MSRILSLALTFAVALGFTAPGHAETATGDCDGWSITVTTRPSPAFEASSPGYDGSLYAHAVATLWRLDPATGTYSVFLESEDELLISEVDETAYRVYPLGALWGQTIPTGEYQVSVRLDYWNTGGVSGGWVSIDEAKTAVVDGGVTLSRWADREIAPFSCESNPPVLARTPGFWKNHPEEWPVASLALGDEGTVFTQECMLGLLDLPTRGDARVKLLHHTIAAKLNLLAGTDPNTLTGFPVETASVEDTIALADLAVASADIFCDALDGERPKGADKQNVVDLKSALDAYNNDEL